MKLRAHANVYPLVDLTEERRAREHRRASDRLEDCVMFIGYQAAPAEAPPGAPAKRWRANVILESLRLGKRKRPS